MSSVKSKAEESFDWCVACLVGSLWLAGAACGGGAFQTSPHHGCANCRWYRGEPLAVPECRVPEDCGQPSNTYGMQCIFGGRCVPVCEAYWGDCNKDYRDGCEQAIDDSYYCPGDPRIGAVAGPAVVFFVRDPSPPSVEGQRQHLTRSLAAQIADLQACYRAALASNPTLAGSSGYRLLFSDAGSVLTAQQLELGPDDHGLTRCTEHALRAARIAEQHVGPRAFIVEVSFDPGGPDS
jgi:hypothetical protein